MLLAETVKTLIILLILSFSCRVESGDWFLKRVEAEEGAICSNREIYLGLCTKIAECAGRLNTAKYGKPLYCKNIHSTVEKLICCPICEREDDDNFHLSYKPNKTKPDGCLIQPVQKVPCYTLEPEFSHLDGSLMCEELLDRHGSSPAVAGGTPARRRQFPHMALLGYGYDPKSADWLCGGSIITNKYILTAAHCISSPSLGKIKYAALGILKRTDDRKMWQIYDIVKIFGHPDYHPPSKYHDIALLETGKEITYGTNVIPACLLKDPKLESKKAIATGWGSLGHRKPLAEILQLVDVVRFSDEECRKAYPVHRHLTKGYDPTTQLCYGSLEEINDTCEGDSGGPLQMDAEEGMKCFAIVFGVTSYGKTCGFKGSSGMYTKVTHYIPWIESIVGKLP